MSFHHKLGLGSLGYDFDSRNNCPSSLGREVDHDLLAGLHSADNFNNCAPRRPSLGPDVEIVEHLLSLNTDVEDTMFLDSRWLRKPEPQFVVSLHRLCVTKGNGNDDSAHN